MKKLLSLLLAVVMAATILTGCGGQSSNSGTTGENSTPQTDKKEKVVVTCWGNQMVKVFSSNVGFNLQYQIRRVIGDI